MNNYPAGVSDNHPYFNPPTCHNCGEVVEPGEKCEECGEYYLTPEDIEEIRAEQKFDMMRDEGLI